MVGYTLKCMRFLWNRRKLYMILIIFQAVLDGISAFPGIYLLKNIFDLLESNEKFISYIITIIYYIVLIVLLSVAGAVVNKILINLKDEIRIEIQSDFDSICLRSKYEKIQSKVFLEQRSFALQALNEDCLEIFINSIQRLIAVFITLIGVIGIVAQFSYLILIPMILSLTISFYYDWLNARQNFDELKERTEYQRKSSYMYSVSRSFEYAKEVRLFNLKDRFQHRMDEIDQLLFLFREAQRKKREPSAILYYASNAILNISAYLYLGWRVLYDGTLTLGGFSACYQSLIKLKSSVEDIIFVITNYAVHKEILRHFFEFMEQEPEPIINKSVERLNSAKIFFDHVSYRYPGAEYDALHDVTITVNNNEKLMIVGENGAGKSTFVKLLCGLYQPSSGVIYLNDVDISTIKPEEYRRQISAVFQDYTLFDLTIEDNVDSLHQEWSNAVPDALVQVKMKELVDAMPHGTNTALFRAFDKEGVEFSGGEMQRLAIARAICKDAPVLVLDEPTSALDPRSEYSINQGFQEIASDRTTVFVSHRMSNARFCDKIAVFSRGKIVEYGTHEELMANKGIYAELYSLQANLYLEGQP